MTHLAIWRHSVVSRHGCPHARTPSVVSSVVLGPHRAALRARRDMSKQPAAHMRRSWRVFQVVSGLASSLLLHDPCILHAPTLLCILGVAPCAALRVMPEQDEHPDENPTPIPSPVSKTPPPSASQLFCTHPCAPVRCFLSTESGQLANVGLIAHERAGGWSGC